MGAELFFNLADDLFVIAVALNGFRIHLDLFNLSLVVGKAFKVAF